MSPSRLIFINQMRTFRSTIAHETLIDGATHEHERNNRAQVLRNGITVIYFSAFEDFLRRRVREVLSSLSANGNAFDTFSEDFQILATLRALDGIRNRAKLLTTKQQRIDLVRNEARKIGSSLATPFDFSDFIFGFDRSNILWDSIENLLKVLNFLKPAECIGCIADRCGIGVIIRIGAKKAFEDLAQARHSAAHDPNAIIQPSNLDDYYIKYMGLAVSFDAIISSICLATKRGGTGFELKNQNFAPEDIDIYFIDDDGNQRFSYMKENAKRYSKRNLGLKEARDAVLHLCKGRMALVVERDLRRFPIFWDCPEL